MDARGERIIIFGDSLSHHGHDAGPEIWDVDAGSSRQSSQPGDLLASLLAEQGAAAVRVNARVGRSAFNFWNRENTDALLASDTDFAPTKVVVVLGTNDIGLNVAGDLAAMKAIKDAYENMGAEVWAIGPVTYNDQKLNDGSQSVVDFMSSLFGGRFIDGRPLSVQVGRAGDGVHFGDESAKQTALNMADALVSTAAPKSFTLLAIGAAAVIGGVLAYSWWKHGSFNLNLHGIPPLDGEAEEVEEVEEAGEIEEVPYKSKPIVWPGALTGSSGFRVAYLSAGATRTWDSAEYSTAEDAQAAIKAFKRRGMTAWVEDSTGAFVPVKGAKRRPGFLRQDSLIPAAELKELQGPSHLFERYNELMLDPDPASMEVIEDLVREHEDKLSDISGAPRAPHGTFDMVKAGTPTDLWKRVSWTVHKVSPHAQQRPEIEIYAANGKARAALKYRVHGSYEYARREATATAWAIAKAIKPLPLMHDAVRENAEFKAIVETAANKPDDMFYENGEPNELYGGIKWPSLSISEAERRARAKARAATQIKGASSDEPSSNDQRIAALVQKAAKSVPRSERPYEDKIFISQIWERIPKLDKGTHVKLTERGFKAWLPRGLRLGLVKLTRADLAPDLDKAKIKASHIHDGGSDFHFVVSG